MPGVSVYARVRPRQPWEAAAECIRLDGKDTIVNQTKKGDLRYGFTEVFGEQSLNSDVYPVVAVPLVEEVLQGFNAVLIVYGQTGSGKSFSMLGVGGEQVGLMPACLRLLLERGAELSLSAVEAWGVRQTKVPLFDLLGPQASDPDWQKKKWKMGKGHITDSTKATTQPIRDESDVFTLVQRAYMASHFAPTGKNPQSSRGHTVYIAHIRHVAEDGFSERKCQMLFADLAGSEGESALTESFRRQVSAEDFKMRGMEAACICTGLTDLGMVFDDLRKHGKICGARGIGLRKILHPFIGSNCVVSVMFTLSPAAENAKSTTSTLNTALNTAKIKLKVVKAKTKVNAAKRVEMLLAEQQDHKTTISDLQSQITQLQNQKRRRKKSVMSMSNFAQFAEQPEFEDKVKETEAFKNMEQNQVEQVSKLNTQIQEINDALNERSTALQEALEAKEKLQTRIKKLEPISQAEVGEGGIDDFQGDDGDVDPELLADQMHVLQEDEKNKKEYLKRKQDWEKLVAKSLRSQHNLRMKTLRDTLTEKFGVDAENLPDVAKYIFGKFSEYDVDQLLDGELDEEREIEMIGPAAKMDVPELKRSRSRSRSVTSRNRAVSSASFSNTDLPPNMEPLSECFSTISQDGDIFREWKGAKALWDEIEKYNPDQMNKLEFIKLFRLVHIVLPVDMLNTIFEKWDIDNSNTLTFDEFELRITQLMCGRQMIQKATLFEILLEMCEIHPCIRAKVGSTSLEESSAQQVIGDYLITNAFENGRPVYCKSDMDDDENPLQLRFSNTRNMWVLGFKQRSNEPIAFSFSDTYGALEIEKDWYVISEEGKLIHCEIEFEASKYEEDFYNSDEDSLDNMDVAYAFQDLLEEQEDSSSGESEESLKDKIIEELQSDSSGHHAAVRFNEDPEFRIDENQKLIEEYVHLECLKIRSKYPQIEKSTEELKTEIFERRLEWNLVSDYLEATYTPSTKFENMVNATKSYVGSWF